MNFGRTNPVHESDDILNLEKGDILDLTKVAPSLHNVVIGCGWTVNVAGKDSFDLDISAFLLGADGRVRKPAKGSVVFFNQPKLPGIYSEGDNLTGGDGNTDDERIHVQLDQIPRDVHGILFNVNIFDAEAKRQTFGMIRNSYIRILDEDDNDKEIARFNLKTDASSSTAVVFAKLNRTANGWSFEAIGETLVVKDLNKLLLRYM